MYFAITSKILFCLVNLGEKMDISPESIVRRKRLPSTSSVKGFPHMKQMRLSISSALEYREGKVSKNSHMVILQIH